MIKPLSAVELKRWLDDPSRERPILLDVREHWEIEKCRFDGIRHIPMHEVPARIDEVGDLGVQRAIVCICHHGVRSMQVASFLQARLRRGRSDSVGTEDDVGIYNLSGGVAAWANEVDPSFPTY